MAVLAGEDATAGDINDAIGTSAGDRQETGFGTTTSTSYTSTLTGGTVAGTTFVAPASGVVIILNNNYMFNSGANSTLCTFEVRTGASIGSGTVVVAAADNNANANTVAAGNTYGRSYRLSGLTPGNTYNVQQRVRVSAGTGTFHRHEVDVIPG